MLSFSFDPGTSQKTIDTIVDNITGLAEKVPAEFTAWQVEDLHRPHPITDIVEQDTGPAKLGAPKIVVSVMTKLWPRWPRMYVHHVAQASTTRRRRTRPKKPTAVRWRKPILRPEMFERLCERMRNLLKSAIPWA